MAQHSYSIDLFAGRSLDAKSISSARARDDLESLDIPADQVEIVLREVSRENWRIGVREAAEIDLGVLDRCVSARTAGNLTGSW